jgi:hypothetical protein
MSSRRAKKTRRRQLLLLNQNKATVTIESPSNGTFVPSNSSQVTCTVAYRETSLLRKTITSVSLLLDNKVVETRTNVSKRKGLVNFTMDTSTLIAGRTHVLQAQVGVSSFFGFSRRTVVSPKQTISKMGPVTDPSPTPRAGPTAAPRVTPSASPKCQTHCGPQDHPQYQSHPQACFYFARSRMHIQQLIFVLQGS